MRTSKPENFRKWLTALRSGEYKQDTENASLRCNDGYCCLGVACVIAEQEGIVKSAPMREQRSGAIIYGLQPERFGEQEVNSEEIDSSVAGLPNVVKNWLGISDNPSSLVHLPEPVNKRLTEVSSLNDCGRYDFPAIADILEQQFLSDGTDNA